MTKHSKNSSNESGYVLIWFSMATLGFLFAGFTFMLYASATISKMKAQYLAMNLTIAGGHNMEFDSQETLNDMMLVAKLSGFRAAAPNQTVQIFGTNTLFFQHTVEPGSTHGVKAYVELNQSPITKLVANLGSIKTASYALSKHSPLYLNLAFDYSASLGGGSIEQLLDGFGVTDGGGGAGPNGIVEGSTVVPTKTIQTIMPFAFEPYLGIALPWNETSAAWPTMTAPADPDCTPTSETTCPSYESAIPTHLSVLKAKASDIFMSYKKAAALLTGVAGRLTPYLDVTIFGGVLDDSVVDAMTDNLGASFSAFVNNGVYSIHEFDEDQYDNYSLDGFNKIIADVAVDYTYDDPKDVFRDPISMAPNRLLQIFLEMTFSRKLLRYGTLKNELGATLVNPRTYSELLDPPLPIIADPQIPNDAFTFTPGPLTNGAYTSQLSNELYFKFGWPGRPSPLLSNSGPLYPANDDIPSYIRYPWEYNCDSGPPIDTSWRLSLNRYDVGNVLCRIYAQCNPGIAMDCATTVGGVNLNVYRKAGVNAPLCPATYGPRCYNESGGGSQSATDAVMCVNGVPRCFPNILMWPKCVDIGGNINVSNPTCCDVAAGACAATWDPSSSPPSYGTHSAATSGTAETNTTTNQPIFRGRIQFPAEEGPDGQGDIFHYLMDLVPLNGGTWTQNAIPISRCQDFKDQFTGLDPSCALILVTDSRPLGVDADGATILSDADMMTELTENVADFTGSGANQLDGRIFTWFLDHTPSNYENLVELLEEMDDAGTLNATAEAIYNTYIAAEATIPLADCADWDANRPGGTPDCNTYNSTILPSHQADEVMHDEFKTLMSTGSKMTWVETTLTNSNSGAEIPITFFRGLEQLMASLKREIQFQK